MKISKKKWLGLVVLALGILSVLYGRTDELKAKTTGDWSYEIGEDGAEVTRYSGNETEVVIPESFDGVKVTSIGNEAFNMCSNLTSISIPNNVTSIGHFAFAYCSKLKDIFIPKSVTTIGDYPFLCCSALESIKVDEKNKYYNSKDDCNALIETKTNRLIVGCNNTKIPDGVTRIDSCAFADCDKLLSVTIPESVSYIGSEAFSGCNGLTEIMIPAGTELGYEEKRGGPFDGCIGLKKIIIDEGNPYYDSRENSNAIIETKSNTILTGCQGTKIPESVTRIGNFAFKGCVGLTEIDIPNGVKEIGLYAFGHCTALESVTISASVNSIEDGAFYYCNLDWIVIDKNNLTYDSREDCNAIIESQTNVLLAGSNNTKIPADVERIEDDAFAGRTRMKSITIPAGVTGIGRDVFSWCSGLESISVDAGNKIYDSRENCNAIIETKTNELRFGCQNTIIPASVRAIDSGAFTGCTGLKSIVIPEGVPDMYYIFDGCTGLSDITIPASVEEISDFHNCDNLTIWTTKGSCAEAYALKRNIPVKYIGNAEETEIPPTNTPELNPSATPVTKPGSIQTERPGTVPPPAPQATKTPGSSSVGKNTPVNKRIGKVKIKKIKAKKGKLEIKWGKVSNAAGYKLQVSTDRKFAKSVNYYTVPGTRKTVSGKRKKMYYIRVRAYGYVNDKRVYGAFSKVKKKKTK